jgi:UDP-N-acetylmuramoyl-tripeptide--D-alanyl-D-alanine ligase
MRWTAGQIAAALGVASPASLAAETGLVGVSIDSRTVKAGELFVAIHGPRHDGHDHLAGAFERGALAAVVSRQRYAGLPKEIQGRALPVDDTLAALHRLAARACEVWRAAKPGRRVGGVAGSVGKTTTKEILAAIVGVRFRVLKTQGNLNNEYGLPLTLLQVEDDHEAIVLEMGMSHRGELARLAQIARPDVGVITRVAVEHLEFFSSVDEIALAERELIENLPWPNATAVLNADDERVARFDEAARGPVIWFGMESRPNPGGLETAVSGRSNGRHKEFRAENIEERGIAGSAFDCVSPSGRVRFELPLIGRHNVMNAVAALAAASVWGIDPSDAKRVFPALVPADKRGEVVRFADGFTVINDTYNSSPTALNALGELLAETPGYRRRILAAGEMRELGASSPELHRECGSAAAGLKNIDWIVGVAGDAHELVRAAVSAGHEEKRAKYFEDSTEAGRFLADFIQTGDLLLLKGSRGVKMEKILEAIDATHARIGSPPSGAARIPTADNRSSATTKPKGCC